MYTALGLTGATFYRYAKILDTHRDEEIKKMTTGEWFAGLHDLALGKRTI